MVQVNFKQSSYTFTDPVRQFKANDPYYYKVENIPIQQLQDNTNWLREQISNLDQIITVNREDLNELRPYVNGSDRVVRVKPGRYSARINDAYNIEQQQYLKRILGGSFGENDTFEIPLAKGGSYSPDGTNLNDSIAVVLAKFQSSVAADAQNMNGLGERAFTYPVQDEDTAFSHTSTTSPTTVMGGSFVRRPPFPISEVIGWANSIYADSMKVSRFGIAATDIGFADLGRLESAFIKRWRGVARLAVVDVPNELAINIPDFDDEDFFFTDWAGQKVKVSASTRIDLLFIYSKPVDSDSNTIGRYNGGSPTTITQPVLGIAQGAGVGVTSALPAITDQYNIPTGNQDSEVDAKIIPHIADINSTTNGFQTLGIHGSFPSPDDLMNQSPMLLESLSNTAYELVGQSVLPVAYVISTKGQNLLVSTDIIDIRPLFRTAELSYNERAGLAAAIPQVSLANPVVSKALLDKESYRSKKYIDAVSTDIVFDPDVPRTVAAGYIKGGYNFGVEGSILHWWYNTNQTSDKQQSWSDLKSQFGWPNEINLNDYPEWDLANWAKGQTNQGLHANDYLSPTWRDRGVLPTFACFESKAQVDNADSVDLTKRRSVNRLQNLGVGTDLGGLNWGEGFVLCSKQIQIDRSQTPWMKDYDVHVNYWNCLPLSQRATIQNGSSQGGHTGIWVDKQYDRFTIFIAWTAEDKIQGAPYNEDNFLKQNGWDPVNVRDGSHFAGFAVMLQDIMDSGQSGAYNNEPPSVLSIYPSVTFTVIGYPSNYSSVYYNLGGAGSIIQLK